MDVDIYQYASHDVLGAMESVLCDSEGLPASFNANLICFMCFQVESGSMNGTRGYFLCHPDYIRYSNRRSSSFNHELPVV